MKRIFSLGLLSLLLLSCSHSKKVNNQSHWPSGDRFIISISMQFESGGQPEGAESPFSGNSIGKKYIDHPANSWFRYGYNEGVLRMLDLWDKHDIKVTSHIVGLAAKKNPKIVKEIFDRGHEAASHGMSWTSQHNMNYKQEHLFVRKGVKAVKDITGVAPVGYNAYWLRRSNNTLKVLQANNFLYHIDDVSRDEPFVTLVRGNKFVIIPYTLRNNDIVLIEGKNFSSDQFLNQLKMEFDQLYSESISKRRMMSISLHDRIGGTPAVVNAMDKFLTYAKKHDGVNFKRKDEIARMIINDPSTPIDNSEMKFNK